MRRAIAKAKTGNENRDERATRVHTFSHTVATSREYKKRSINSRLPLLSAMLLYYYHENTNGGERRPLEHR